jgi:hypothetical protein
MGYLIPPRPVMPIVPLPVVPKQRTKVSFCNAEAVKAVANLRKGEMVSCDTYIVRPIEEA